MNKKEFWQRIWIPIKKRIPPADDDKYVLVWNPDWKEPRIIESYIARNEAKTILAVANGDKDAYISPDRFYNKWCMVMPPEKK